MKYRSVIQWLNHIHPGLIGWSCAAWIAILAAVLILNPLGTSSYAEAIATPGVDLNEGFFRIATSYLLFAFVIGGLVKLLQMLATRFDFDGLFKMTMGIALGAAGVAFEWGGETALTLTGGAFYLIVLAALFYWRQRQVR